MKTIQRIEMYDNIIKHGEQLKVIFQLDQAIDPVALCKKLRRIEGKQYSSNLSYCNGTISSDQHEKVIEKTKKALIKVLGDKVPVYINSDPRDYALKINNGIMRYNEFDLITDWGGYGLIAPDLFICN